MLVVIEGLDGVGKSTQIEKLSERFFKENIKFETFREPGSTELGNLIRNQVFKNPNFGKLNPVTELFLMEASRSELCNHILNKYSDEELYGPDAIILLDRFIASTYAYQGASMKLKNDYHSYIFGLIREINNLATFSIKPSLSILLDLDLQTVETRLNSKNVKDKFEEQGMPFFKKVKTNYQTYMYETGWRENWVVINSDGLEINQVTDILYNTIIEHRK